MPQQKKQNLIVSIFGRKGSGKSFLANELVQNAKRVIVLDVMSEYENGFSVANGFRDACEALRASIDMRKFRLSIQDCTIEQYLLLLRVVWHFTNIVLVIEESSLFATPSILPNEVENLVLRGRHRNISQLWIAQRPALVNRNVTAQSDLVVTFWQQEPRDLMYLRSFGFDTVQITKLPKYKVQFIGDRRIAPESILKRETHFA